ncbi:hypothetical protein [Brevundimonas sp. TWP2-3-4b1]|uniref:hypothetical protein n=1 Tax=Brevundimonas sp. TWP2-3-4b1 TaxID=2804580 RepID=UPI003CF4EB34
MTAAIQTILQDSMPTSGLPVDLTPKVALPVNGVITLDNAEYIVERRVNDRWQILSFENEPVFLTDREVLSAMGAGRLFVQSSPMTAARSPMSPLVTSEKAARKNHQKYEYVSACRGLPRSRPSLSPIIERVAAELGNKAPSFNTVLNWLDLDAANGLQYGTAALSDRDDCKGKRGSRLPFWQEAGLSAGVERWLTPGETMASAYSAVEAAVAAFNAQEGQLIDRKALNKHQVRADGSLKAPTLKTFERRCHAVNQIERDMHKKGLAYVKQRYSAWQSMLLPDRPYAEVECDHCTLDIQIIDTTGLVLGRPDIIVFIDRATKGIVGHSIGFEAPSYASFVKGLKSTYFEKDLTPYPAVTNPWPWVGRIGTLYVDNAFHFIGNDIKAAGHDLGFNTTILPPRSPWLKGSIERFFGTLNMGLVHRLPGTTLNDVKKRRDAENLTPPSLTLDAFEALFVYWICQIYHVTPHRGLSVLKSTGDTPLKAWADKLSGYSTPGPPSPDTFLSLAGERKTRVIGRAGIEWDRIFYQSPDLTAVQSHPGNRRGKGTSTRYQVIRDPSDLGAITLVNHHTNETVTVPAAHAYASYAQGTSLHQHKVCLARAKERRKMSDIELADLVASRELLSRMIQEILDKPSTKKVHSKLARYLSAVSANETD